MPRPDHPTSCLIATVANPIILALDTPSLDQCLSWVQQLHPHVGAFKVGLEFLHARGPEGVRALHQAGASRLFTDTKFCDIPNTVAGASRSITELRPWMFNLHALAGSAAMAAGARASREAADAAGHPAPLVIAVTVLTSLGNADLQALGIGGSPLEAAVRLACLAQEAGLDGVVASPQEVGAIRSACGPEFLIITPGVRPAGGDVHDQARVATPEAAIRAGADYLVVGRAITGVADPAAAALAILDSVAEARDGN